VFVRFGGGAANQKFGGALGAPWLCAWFPLRYVLFVQRCVEHSDAFCHCL